MSGPNLFLRVVSLKLQVKKNSNVIRCIFCVKLVVDLSILLPSRYCGEREKKRTIIYCLSLSLVSEHWKNVKGHPLLFLPAPHFRMCPKMCTQEITPFVMSQRALNAH